MALDPIPPYRVPEPEDYPVNRAGWSIDPARAVILVHDMQHYFVDPFVFDEAGTSPVSLAIRNIRLLRDVAARVGIPVLFSAQPAGQSAAERGLTGEFWGPGLQGESAADIVDELAPHGSDRMLAKRRYSAFVRTPLGVIMREAGRDQLVVVGVYASTGCLLTLSDAFMRDIQPFLIGDAVADVTREDHLHAMSYAALRCAVVQTTAAAIRSIESAVEARAAMAGGAASVGSTWR